MVRQVACRPRWTACRTSPKLNSQRPGTPTDQAFSPRPPSSYQRLVFRPDSGDRDGQESWSLGPVLAWSSFPGSREHEETPRRHGENVAMGPATKASSAKCLGKFHGFHGTRNLSELGSPAHSSRIRQKASDPPPLVWGCRNRRPDSPHISSSVPSLVRRESSVSLDKFEAKQPAFTEAEPGVLVPKRWTLSLSATLLASCAWARELNNDAVRYSPS